MDMEPAPRASQHEMIEEQMRLATWYQEQEEFLEAKDILLKLNSLEELPEMHVCHIRLALAEVNLRIGEYDAALPDALLAFSKWCKNSSYHGDIDADSYHKTCFLVAEIYECLGEMDQAATYLNLVPTSVRRPERRSPEVDLSSIHDLRERRYFLSQNSIARYDRGSLEANVSELPPKRRFVKLACPGSKCSPDKLCDWICYQCLTPLEYGFTDNFIYCGCGRVLYSSYGFRCKNKQHGLEYSIYDKRMLLWLLNNLSQSSYLNILVLGEAGVEKSTFINAFVNYLSFETLDKAKKCNQLPHLKPWSFWVQGLDLSHDDLQRKEIYIESGLDLDQDVRIGGDSATNKPTAYEVSIGASKLRLIDTPGIGDTYGTNFDRHDLNDILTALSSYDELHGVLILIESNSSCPKNSFVPELLMLLHQSAKEILAFGFRHSQISNHAPEDAFAALEKICTQCTETELELSPQTVYGFDFEGFRYLAAFKNRILMDNEEFFRQSWDHSRYEALRLVKFLESTRPHPTKRTIDLNITRALIPGLMASMQEITQSINNSMSTVYKGHVEELERRRLWGDELAENLHIEKMQLVTRELEHPRLVCADKSCVEYKFSGDGISSTDYTTICQDKCYLDNITYNTLSNPSIQNCAVFVNGVRCSKCLHHWQSHMIVMYELHEEVITLKDPDIERELESNARMIGLENASLSKLQETLQEYTNEYQKVQEAVVLFGIFLRKHTIMGEFRDTPLEYFDYLIRQEKGSEAPTEAEQMRILNLEQNRKEYQELLETLALDIDVGNFQHLLSEEGVSSKVEELCKMKHFGNKIKVVADAAASAYSTTDRERASRTVEVLLCTAT